MLHRNGIYSEYRDDVAAPVESRQLEEEGYAIIRQAFTPVEISDLAADVERVFREFPADARNASRPAAEDNMFRYEMLNRSAAAQAAVAHRRILDVIEPLLGEDCHVIANTAWRNEPHYEGTHGGGNWHIDAGPHIPLPEGVTWPADIPHPVFAIGVHIYLKDCHADDGPTGVIPGSHLSGRFPPFRESMDPGLTWSGRGVVPLLAKAGDAGLFVSDVWYRRMPTGADDQGRFFLQVHYGRRDIAQRIRPTSEVNHLSPAAISRAVTERERQLIGLHPKFFYDG